MAGLVPGAHARDWVLSNSLVDAVGRHISAAREDLAILHAQQARIDPQEYLLSLGWRRALSFQPADRFWTFQAIEAGIFVALAAHCSSRRCGSCSDRPRDGRRRSLDLDRARLLRSLGVGAAATRAAGCRTRGPGASGFVEPHPRWRFVFVNHATTNPFFVPTRYGIQDACRHYGATYEWTGLDGAATSARW